MVFAVNPGLVRTAMSESVLSCGEPSIEQWFTDAFTCQHDVSAESAATLVTYLASGAADVLSGRNISAAEDEVAQIAVGGCLSGTTVPPRSAPPARLRA